ncbi:MAG: response regulator transcription factor [Chloroflexota bacterium]
MSPPRVLVIDDEDIVREVVTRYLETEGYEVFGASDGAEGLRLANSWSPDLIVLDLMLPVMDGLAVCRAVRANSRVPIIMLSARGEEMDRVLGLELGADDYVVKPFSPRELVARVRAMFRRIGESPGSAHGGALRFPGLVIHPGSRGVEAGDHRVELTAKEFDLLLHLASSAGQVFTREQLMDQVWDYQYAGDASTVTVHIRRLREKVEVDPAHPRFIKTVWGVGYKFEELP